MIEEWRNFESIPTSPRALFRGETYEEFLEIIENNRTSNQLGVPATLFFFMEDDMLLGALQLRHHIEHPNLSLDGGCGGHIGYGLRPNARGKGLAKVMLGLGLGEAKKLGLTKVLISAHSENIASWKTIEGLEGEFIQEIDDEGKGLRVYWIKIP
ncbi:MAG: GNAT family N-acetyltransferase [Candidatus Altimarinota bacterium]